MVTLAAPVPSAASVYLARQSSAYPLEYEMWWGIGAKVDELCTKPDGLYSKSDGLYSKSDGFYRKVMDCIVKVMDFTVKVMDFTVKVMDVYCKHDDFNGNCRSRYTNTRISPLGSDFTSIFGSSIRASIANQ